MSIDKTADYCNCGSAPIPHRHGRRQDAQTAPAPIDAELTHLFEYALLQPTDCTTALEVRKMLRRALELGDIDRRKLAQIESLEVHGGEFIDAADLYAILGKPIPAAVDHAAEIRARSSE